MYSINFPDIFSNTSTNLASDHDATMENIRLALLSYKGTLFGDPYFGSNLIKFLYENNSTVTRDLAADDIYTTIRTFVPQVYLKPSDIQLTGSGHTITANINAMNRLDYITNRYKIQLTESEQ